jgi:hypothetical protein
MGASRRILRWQQRQILRGDAKRQSIVLFFFVYWILDTILNNEKLALHQEDHRTDQTEPKAGLHFDPDNIGVMLRIETISAHR